MKKLMMVLMLLVSLLQGMHAQELGTVSADNDKVKRSMLIAREMVKMIRAMPDSFRICKGEFVVKDGDGNSLYQSNDSDLNTEQQYVQVLPSGSVMFTAVWKKKDKDDKTPIYAFAAFTGGILNATDGQGYAVSNPVTDSVTAEMKYYLKAPGKDGPIIASMKFNPVIKQSTFYVGDEKDLRSVK